MSANIETDVDPIDADYDVNSVLGYGVDKKLERSISNDINSVIENIYEKKNRLNDIKKLDKTPSKKLANYSK